MNSSRDLRVVVVDVADVAAATVGCCCGVKGDAVVAVWTVSRLRLKIRGTARRDTFAVVAALAAAARHMWQCS